MEPCGVTDSNGPPEVCDGIDNDCDGLIDEGFNVGGQCAGASDPAGCMPGDPGGCCQTLGMLQCLPDHSGTFCQTVGPVKHQQPEGPWPAASCFDHVDNDCDGLKDQQQAGCQHAEACNGLDDDGDGNIDNGFPVGQACAAGTGACVASGVLVCNATQDGTVCNAIAGNPIAEGPPGGSKCTDGVDNDCDGLTDILDPDCQQPEKCNGLDDDGDGVIDNGFLDKGQPCKAGTGACEAAGISGCRPDGTGTVCNAVPGQPSPEGPAGSTCSDGIDNDCDGLTDLNDASCNSALLKATCSLPLLPGQRIPVEPSTRCTSR